MQQLISGNIDTVTFDLYSDVLATPFSLYADTAEYQLSSKWESYVAVAQNRANKDTDGDVFSALLDHITEALGRIKQETVHEKYLRGVLPDIGAPPVADVSWSAADSNHHQRRAGRAHQPRVQVHSTQVGPATPTDVPAATTTQSTPTSTAHGFDLTSFLSRCFCGSDKHTPQACQHKNK